jgi:hypothetical protein
MLPSMPLTDDTAAAAAAFVVVSDAAAAVVLVLVLVLAGTCNASFFAFHFYDTLF